MSEAVARERTLSEQLESMNEHMEELAAAGEWQQVGDLMMKRNAMLQELNTAERREALDKARQSTECIRAMAVQARREVAARLANLQRGREATDCYRANV